MFYIFILNVLSCFKPFSEALKPSSINASLASNYNKNGVNYNKNGFNYNKNGVNYNKNGALTITKMVLTITKMVRNYNIFGSNYNKNGVNITFLLNITRKIFCYSWRFVIMNLKGRRIPYVHNKSNQN